MDPNTLNTIIGCCVLGISTLIVVILVMHSRRVLRAITTWSSWARQSSPSSTN